MLLFKEPYPFLISHIFVVGARYLIVQIGYRNDKSKSHILITVMITGAMTKIYYYLFISHTNEFIFLVNSVWFYPLPRVLFDFFILILVEGYFSS